MDEKKVTVEAAEAVVNNVNGNLKVVAGTAILTIAITAGAYFGVRAIKKGISERKQKKNKVIVESKAE